MGLFGLFARYTISFVLLNIATSLVLGILGLKSNSGVSIGILYGAALIACTAFGKKNHRLHSDYAARNIPTSRKFIYRLSQAVYPKSKGLSPQHSPY